MVRIRGNYEAEGKFKYKRNAKLTRRTNLCWYLSQIIVTEMYWNIASFVDKGSLLLQRYWCVIDMRYVICDGVTF